tara:strand:+ start:5012 stop:5608 length:597 start_codon:yes stop_codon:yes gene_type:complete
MIYIARHGQTEWNLQTRKQGRKDSPLTLKGIGQARDVGEILKVDVQDLSKFKVVISPQWRCQQSASIICEQAGVSFSDCVLEEDLREHCFGLWEGRTEEEIEKEFPGYLAKRYVPENYWDYVVPMGESYALLSKRVQRVLEKYKGQNVIFVCHEMVSKVMRGSILGLANEEVLSLGHPQDTVYKIEGSQLSELRRDDR